MTDSELTLEEKHWIVTKQFRRLTDGQEIQIYPMGAERYLAHALTNHYPNRYALSKEIINKNVLVIPGQGNNGFLFAQAGAKSVAVYDKDPVTIAWLKSFKCYYFYQEKKDLPTVEQLLTALTAWYPPLLPKIASKIAWLVNPNYLRYQYIHYLIHLIQTAIDKEISYEFSCDYPITFKVNAIEAIDNTSFDVIYIPYLLGVKNGLESELAIKNCLKRLIQFSPKALIMVTPCQTNHDFYFFGKRYLVLKNYSAISQIPELFDSLKTEDKKWFRRQGLAIFSKNN